MASLTKALSVGKTPGNIVDKILVTFLDLGSVAPELEILEISELTESRFKGIFKLAYAGDGNIVLQTRVQANPLVSTNRKPILGKKRGVLCADQPLIVPLQIRISEFKLKGVIVLVLDREKGVTLVFKNDPLDSVRVNSTFDSVPSIARLLQRQIEASLRNLFQTDLPLMIHKLSLGILEKRKSPPGSPLQMHRSNSMPVMNTTSIETPKPTNETREWIKVQRQLSSPETPLNYLLQYQPPRHPTQESQIEEGEFVLYRRLSFSATDGDVGLSRLVDHQKSLEKHEYGGASTLYQQGKGFMPYTSEYLKKFLQPPLKLEEEREDKLVWNIPVQDLGRHYLAPMQVRQPSPTRPKHSRVDSFGEDGRASALKGKQRELEPSENQLAAHLANLLNSHQSLSPHSRQVEHFTSRTRSGMSSLSSVALKPGEEGEPRPLGACSSRSLGSLILPKKKDKLVAKSVHTVKVPASVLKAVSRGSSRVSSDSPNVLFDH